MATNTILDADMATVAGWIRRGFAWWGNELGGIMPWAFSRRERVASIFTHYREDGKLAIQGTENAGLVLVDPALCLVRRITLPELGEADLARLVALDADRIMPIPSNLLIIAARANPENRSDVTVVGLRRTTVNVMLEAFKAEGLSMPYRIGLFDPIEPGRMAADFTAACAEAGLIAPVRAVALSWWTAVGFLFALNVGLLVWRDLESVRRMETLVSAQAPAVNTARAITKRISATQRSAEALANRRAQQNALAVLAAVTAALPERAWVQRFSWDGRTVKLSGYKRAGVDVIGALRKSPHFADVRAASAEALAEVPTGQPFDLTATIKRGVS
jgi:hypothetical protein